jgi:hypothetical protein
MRLAKAGLAAVVYLDQEHGSRAASTIDSPDTLTTATSPNSTRPASSTRGKPKMTEDEYYAGDFTDVELNCHVNWLKPACSCRPVV